MYDDARQYDQALEQLRKTIEMDKNFGEAHLSLANVYQRKGMYREAIEERQTGLVLLGRDPEILARRATALKAAYEKAGARGYWQERLNQAQENWNQGRGLASEVARCYARLEEKDEAFTWLEKAYQRREQSFRILKNEPDYDGLRSDPRFQELLRRIGFPP
jgi:lipopolysaccharide biosynthesis regulator YciM